VVPNNLKEYGASKTSGPNYLTLHHITEDLNPQQMRCESHKSNDKNGLQAEGDWMIRK